MLPKTAKDTKDSQSRLDFFLMRALILDILHSDLFEFIIEDSTILITAANLAAATDNGASSTGNSAAISTNPVTTAITNPANDM